MGQQLQFNYGSGVTAGSALTWKTAGYFDTNGNWNLPAQPYIQYSSTNTVSTTTGVWTNFSGWNTTVVNQGGITLSSGTTFTVPTAGKYHMTVETI
jgi:hypothetical protein